MSKIAAVKARLGLTNPEHDRELREIFDAIAEAHPALAQSDLVQVEVVVRRFQLEKIEAAHRELRQTTADFKAGLPKVAEEAVEYQRAEMLHALRQGARSEIGRVGDELRRQARTGDPAEPAKSIGKTATWMTATLVFGVAVGLAMNVEYADAGGWLRLDYAMAAFSGVVGTALVRACVTGIVRVFLD